PFYQKIEELSAIKVRNLFKGDIKYSLNTADQKRFETEIEGYRFYAFLDGYQEDEIKIRVIESKATTSKKYRELEYVVQKGEKESVFIVSPDGILRLRHTMGFEVNEAYYEKLKKLMERLDKMGRYVYDIAYQRFVIEEEKNIKKPTEYYLAVLNREYVYDGRKDAFNEPLYTDDIITLIDVTWLTDQMMEQVKADCEIV